MSILSAHRKKAKRLAEEKAVASKRLTWKIEHWKYDKASN